MKLKFPIEVETIAIAIVSNGGKDASSLPRERWGDGGEQDEDDDAE